MRRLALLCLVLATGCPQPPPPVIDAGPCELEVQWGRDPGCVFEPFKDGDRAELTLGFQGFRYIESATRVTGAPEPMAKLEFEVEVEGQGASVQPAGMPDLIVGSDGASYAQVLLFLNDIPIASLIGKGVDVTLFATSAHCRAASPPIHLTLVDDLPGIQGPDGGVICQF